MVKSTLDLYFDHSATTPVDPRVVQAMEPYWTEHFGNASSLYRYGREARRALERAREAVAGVLECPPPAIIFTSGGTESDNTAIKGAIAAQWPAKRHIVTTAIEHEAILHTCEALQRYGVETTLIGVNRDGLVD
ncbi:MAG: aminotransferase class V-fold PLP-dependent enzyme, partial [Chloroflexi bacterium]|nr:aminotransferase class V-fold PLP-dependent enzyme [Chloroflexota bacterium]